MKKVLTIIIFAMIAVVVVSLVIMISVSEAKTVLRAITPTPAAVKAYAEGEDILSHDVKQELSFDGYMRCYALVYIPDEGELQVTVKSNNSVYEKLSTTAERGFVFKLYDVETEREFTEYTEVRASEGRYGYYRLAFSGVEFSEDADLELVMLSPDNEERGSVIKLHKAGQEFEEYELTDDETVSLGGKLK